MSSVTITPPPLSAQSMADLLCTIVLLCRGKTTDNQDFWAYLCIKPSMAASFKEAQGKGNYNLEDFGTILESGIGALVPADVAARMERDYGVRHDYEEQMLRVIDEIKRREQAKITSD